jgi:hypothetical protein
LDKQQTTNNKQQTRKTNKNMKNKILATVTACLVAVQIQASSVKIFDDSLSVLVSGVAYTNTASDLGARLGTWDAGTSTFTQFSGSGGYYSVDLGELSTILDKTSNVAPYTASTQFSMAVYNKAANLDFASNVAFAVLTDSTWRIPAFDLGTSVTTFGLTASTTALAGSYNYGSGNQTIGLVNLAAVPEPSVASLLALGTVGLVALRARRKS